MLLVRGKHDSSLFLWPSS